MKDGFVIKNKNSSQISSEDIDLINKLTRRKFTKEEVYVFSVVLCDNDVDRDFEKFTDEALEKLEKMYVGKTGILDHNPKSENQTARIFKCFLEIIPERKNLVGKTYKRLVAKAYMPKSKKNEDIILQIDSGIKKEVSVGCLVEKVTCSICGKEMKSDLCSHIKGRNYKKDDKPQLCYAILDNPTDAYEWSFVAVPAQREEGVIKSYKTSLKTSKGGEKNMQEIIKTLGLEDLNGYDENDMNKICKTIESLKEKAKIGELYEKELKEQIIKLSAVTQPELDINLMKGICEKLSAEELKSLKKAFETKLSKIFPAKPQFTPEKVDLPKKENTEFKI